MNLALYRAYLLSIVSIFLWVSAVHGAQLSDSKYFHYEVLFTNPQCGPYPYSSQQYSNSNRPITEKVKNVYCKFRDAWDSGSRDSSPQKRLRQWIKDPSTKEIFMTYLSFSSSSIRNALCEEIKERDLKLTFVLDYPEPRLEDKDTLNKSRKALRYPVDREVYQNILNHDKMKAARYIIRNCQAKNKENNPTLYLRGHVPGIGWSHNKLTIINPNSQDKMGIIFSSGNMSSGVVLHHENWHFVKTSVNTHFAQLHLCLKNAMLYHSSSGRGFSDYIHACRSEVSSKYKEESDIKVFLVPAKDDGYKALSSIRENLWKSTSIGVAAHRFSYGALIDTFENYLSRGNKIRLVVDDDIYWASDSAYRELSRANNTSEQWKVNSLMRKGASVRYMQTNHWDNLLHHNKFIIFYNRGKAFAAFAGAGNFTGTAFGVGKFPNLENFYLISIPSVVEAMAWQYNKMWHEMATSQKDMPKKNVPDKEATSL